MKAKLAQEYTDDLVYSRYLRARQSLLAHGGGMYLPFAREYGRSPGLPGRTSQAEMDCFCAAGKVLLAIMVSRGWRLAKWCLFHGARLLWRALAGLYRLITDLLRRRRFMLQMQESFARHHPIAQGFTHRRRRRHGRSRSTAVRRSRRR